MLWIALAGVPEMEFAGLRVESTPIRTRDEAVSRRKKKANRDKSHLPEKKAFDDVFLNDRQRQERQLNSLPPRNPANSTVAKRNLLTY